MKPYIYGGKNTNANMLMASMLNASLHLQYYTYKTFNIEKVVFKNLIDNLIEIKAIKKEIIGKYTFYYPTISTKNKLGDAKYSDLRRFISRLINDVSAGVTKGYLEHYDKS